MNKVFVYGTLRPNLGETVKVRGQLFSLGRFPGIKLGMDGVVTCEVITVDDDELARLDRYEGYNPQNLQGSLYIRRRHEDGFIYNYNGSVRRMPLIESGDWFKYLENTNG